MAPKLIPEQAAQASTSPEAINQDALNEFNQASGYIRGLVQSRDEGFQNKCLEAGIDPFDDAANIEYWKLLEAYGNQALQETYSVGEIDDFTYDVRRISLAAPVYALQQIELNQQRNQGQQIPRESRRTVSEFNADIYGFVQAYPDVRAQTLMAGLGSIIEDTVYDAGPALEGEYGVKAAIRGARHEFGVIQSLDYIEGIGYKETGTEEDLKGVDTTVIFQSGQEINVDIKASVNQLIADAEKHGGEQEVEFARNHGYYQRRGGTYVLFSHLKDGDFEGGSSPEEKSFRLREDVAPQRAAAIEDTLHQIVA